MEEWRFYIGEGIPYERTGASVVDPTLARSDRDRRGPQSLAKILRRRFDRLGSQAERIEILHRLHSHSARGQSTLEKFLDRLTAHDRTFFVCTRGDLLSGNIGRILRIHPSQALFVDRIVLTNFVASGITVWGETIRPLVPVAPIRRFDVFKALFGFPMAMLVRGGFPATSPDDQIRYGSTREFRAQLLLLLRTAPRVFGGGNQLLRAPWGRTVRSFNCSLCAASIGIRSYSSSGASQLWCGSTY
jgi:hypothetical protein